MSSENLATISTTDEVSALQPNRSISSSTVVTRRNQISTQRFITSRQIESSSGEMNSSLEADSKPLPMSESSLVSINQDGPKTTRKITTTTYRRRIIRRTGPNGEVTEEIIEEGDPIVSGMLSLPQQSTQMDDSTIAIGGQSGANISQGSVSGVSRFQAMGGFKSISDTGEEQTANFSTGPINGQFMGLNQKMITNDSRDLTDDNNGFPPQNSSCDAVQEILQDGSIVTRKFFSSQSATVTKSSTINGETKTSSKSAFMCYTGENVLQASSTMHDMEDLFKEMTSQMRIEGFGVLNQFMLSSSNNVTDHLALAGGHSDSSLFAIEGPEITNEIHDTGSSKLRILTRPLRSIMGTESTQVQHIPALPSRESIIKVEEQQQEEVRQKIISIKEQKASNRLYWSNMDDVRSSGILSDMRKDEVHLQEGIFEIITSEASYNISLDILIDFYYKNDLLDPNKEGAVINSVEKHHLFSNILLVKGVSLQFLKDLENRWSQSKPRILDLADIILKHAESKEFEQQYVNYLANQSYQINALRSLLQKDSFKAALEIIQNNPKCCKLSLDSFLALPMQRLTRLKLLIDVVLKLMNQSKDLFNSIPNDVVTNHLNALQRVKELLNKSEAKKFEMEQKARLIDLVNILEFGNGCKNVPIGAQELKKEGELKAHLPQTNPNALKKLSKKRQPSFYLIVLSNLVIIAKKKSITKLVVLDYCDRALVEAIPNSYTCPKINRERSNLSASSNALKDSSDNLTQVVSGPTFTLKFKKSESDALTESLILDTPTADIRDQWVDAITLK